MFVVQTFYIVLKDNVLSKAFGDALVSGGILYKRKNWSKQVLIS